MRSRPGVAEGGAAEGAGRWCVHAPACRVHHTLARVGPLGYFVC
jgi:hypothetical protein